MGADGVAINEMGSGNVTELSGEALGAVKFKPLGGTQVGTSCSWALNVRVDDQYSDRTGRIQCRLLGMASQDLIAFQHCLKHEKAGTYLRVLDAKTGPAHA